jgi:hypothetical protein
MHAGLNRQSMVLKEVKVQNGLQWTLICLSCGSFWHMVLPYFALSVDFGSYPDFLEFAAERLALRTPAEIATDLIPDRPLICRFPGIKHFFILKEWLETGIKPSCESKSGLF